MIGYTLFISLAFLFLAHKSRNFENFVAGFIVWWCSPILFVFFMVVAWYDKKNWRWLKDKWIQVAIKHFFLFLIYGKMKIKNKLEKI